MKGGGSGVELRTITRGKESRPHNASKRTVPNDMDIILNQIRTMGAKGIRGDVPSEN